MGKINISCKNGVFILLNKLRRGEDINARELDIIAGGGINSVLPVYSDQKKKRVLRCEIVGCMTLSDFLRISISKKTFFRLVSQTLALFRVCEARAMHVRNIEFDFNYVFVDLRTHNLRFIYWPVVNCTASSDISAFLQTLVKAATFLQNEDTSYVRDYVRFSERAIPFSVNAYERFVEEHQEQRFISESANKDSSTYALPHQTNTVKNISYTPNYEADNHTVFIEQDRDTAAQAKHVIIQSDTNDDNTTFLGVGAYFQKTAYLLREKTGEKIEIHGDYFKIGTKPTLADYVITDNKTISRHHASIFYENGRYFLIDNNSTNKTMLNDAILPPNNKVEIFSGARIKLSNEIFVFNVNSAF